MAQKLTLATLNLGKIKEFEAVFADTTFILQTLDKDKVTLPKEGTLTEGATLISNAQLKAEFVRDFCKGWALADDSGLFVEALPHELGVDTATYGGPDKLLDALRNVPVGQRNAAFRCTLALARPGLETVFFHGHIHGTVALERRGSGGFGYDSVFIPNGETLTNAEAVDARGTLGKADDHRGRALKAFFEAFHG